MLPALQDVLLVLEACLIVEDLEEFLCMCILEGCLKNGLLSPPLKFMLLYLQVFVITSLNMSKHDTGS